MNENLRAALDPKSVAVIGASQNPDKVGGRPIDYLKRFGFKGRIMPVNPARSEIQGLKAYPDVSSMPEAPEAVIVALPGEEAVSAVLQCAEMGTKVGIVMSSGFGEGGSAEGKAREARMVAQARAKGMRLVGPNSQGLANFGTGAILSFSTMFKESVPADGHVAVLSQSGALSVVPYGFLRRRGIGVRHTHATGNDADVTVAELAAAVAEDSAVKLMLLYLEGIPDPEHLAQVAMIARERRMPVLALKSGRTAAGQAAAQSHTGALANEDRVVDAFLEHHGIWRAQTMEELVDATALYLKGWKAPGRRLVAVSNSGAAGVLSADAASFRNMPLAQFSKETLGALGQILPDFANITNPVDVTGALLSDSSLFGKTLSVIASDKGADAFVIAFPVAGAGYDVKAFAAAAGELEKTSGKPVIAAAPQPNVAAVFEEHGIPTFATESHAISCLHQIIRHDELIQAASMRAPSAEAPKTATGKSTESNKAPRMLNEAASLKLLAASGVPTVQFRLCATSEEAVSAFRHLGGPVAIKGCSSEVAHKTELGIVKLNVASEDAVKATFEVMIQTLAQHGHASEGVIVAEMAKGRHELMIGAHRDPVFGPVLVIGNGGKYVEALPDVQLLLPPVSAEAVKGSLSKLRVSPIFKGVRGELPMDIDAFAKAAAAVGNLMVTNESIASIDLNPVVLRDRGQGCFALDAVVFQAADL